MRRSATRFTALVLGLMLALTLSTGCNWGNVNIGIIIPLGLTSENGLLSFLNGNGQVTGGDGTSTPPLPTPPDIPGTTGGTTGTTGGTSTT